MLPSRSPRSILVVDDSRLSRMISSKYVLSRYADWVITEAETGEEAIAKAAVEAPFLILLDVNMPGMGGMAAAAILRAAHPATHIVLLTANVQHAVQRQAMEMGIAFVPKPIQEAQLHAVLDTLEQLP